MKTERIDLTRGWTVRPTDSPDADPLPATVPGSVQADLLAAGRMPDPFVGTNEAESRRVARESWTYRCVFEAPERRDPEARAALVFEGLDTFARVLLNGRPVGDADNMFRPWRFDVTGDLAAGENELVVRFEPTEARAAALAEAYGQALPANTPVPNAPFVRKAPCHFGWDWGPALVPVGIWRPVRLEIVPRGRIGALDAWGLPETGEAARIGASVEADGPRTGDLRLSVTVTGPGGGPVGAAEAALEGGRAVAEVPVDGAQLWWPNGMGAQPLYRVDVRLVASGGTAVDERRVRVGVRGLELVREADTLGESFYFRANGRPMFAKGANWVPADALPARPTPGHYRRLLGACRDAGFNMVRVWGGGSYEAEAFYEACDEMGLLVWHDFMYACAMYPGDDEAFLDNARAEAEWAVRHLRRHTSLALWCGNNEIEWGWRAWGWRDRFPGRLWDAYGRLFHEMLPAVVAEHDPRRPYVPSSPFSKGSAEDLALDSNGPDTGDAHVWTVWHGSLDPAKYRETSPRFVSEFGFQSLPPVETLRTAVPDEAMRLDSPEMLAHQKCKDGNKKIAAALDAYFGGRAAERPIADLVYLSQVYQARAVRLGVEHWRRAAPRTMGTLYWQANDCWPVASWSSLDYAGRWKALHYAAKRFYAPYLVSGTADSGGARLFVTADPAAGPLEARLEWEVRTWAGEPVGEAPPPIAVTIDPGATVRAAEVKWADLGAAPADVYAAARLGRGEEEIGRTVLVPLAPAEVGLPDPHLEVLRVAGGAAELATKNVALWVHLEAEGLAGRFADNFFDLVPGEARRVAFVSDEPVPDEDLAGRLTVRSLSDVLRRSSRVG